MEKIAGAWIHSPTIHPGFGCADTGRAGRREVEGVVSEQAEGRTSVAWADRDACEGRQMAKIQEGQHRAHHLKR